MNRQDSKPGNHSFMYGEETDVQDVPNSGGVRIHENDEEEMSDIQKTLGHLQDSPVNPFKDNVFGVVKDEEPKNQVYDLVNFDVNFGGDDDADNLLSEDKGNFFGLDRDPLDDPDFIMRQKAEYEKYAQQMKNQNPNFMDEQD